MLEGTKEEQSWLYSAYRGYIYVFCVFKVLILILASYQDPCSFVPS
jgi:hypothetical protein